MANAVTSNQTDIYKNLEQVVCKYATTCFLRPIADHTREAFESAKQFVQNYYQDIKVQPTLNGPGTTEGLSVILDSGCGTGESTLHLASKFPGIPVIGVDKSAMRLNKAGNEHQLKNVTQQDSSIPGHDNVPANAFWIRAELLDFWRLALEEVQAGRWNIVHHAIYYPNPWPKESEATRRFHLHPIFPTMMSLSPTTEMRTNWEIYAREFAEASRILGDESCQTRSDISKAATKISCEPFEPNHPETAFERKYKEARQQLWRVMVKR